MRQPGRLWWRLGFLAFVAVMVPVGLAVRRVDPTPGSVISSVLYELMLVALAMAAVPYRRAVVPVCVGVCLLTVTLEFLQLWQPPWLQSIRATRLGQGALGSSFDWRDLPTYPLGCAIGAAVLLKIMPLERQP